MVGSQGRNQGGWCTGYSTLLKKDMVGSQGRNQEGWCTGYSPSLRKGMVESQGRNQKGWCIGYSPSLRKATVKSQGRNQEIGTEADTGGRLLANLISMACSACSLLQPRTTYLGVALPTVAWPFPHASLIKRLPPRHGHRPVWWRQFLDWDSLSRWLNVVSIGHKTKAHTHLYSQALRLPSFHFLLIVFSSPCLSGFIHQVILSSPRLLSLLTASLTYLSSPF